MSEQLFKVIFEGDIIPGNHITVVRRKLARLFKIDEKKADRLFTGSTREVKRAVNASLAKKYVMALAKLGALSYMLPEIDEPVREEMSIPDEFTETGSFHVSELAPRQGEVETVSDDKTEPDYALMNDSDTTVPMDIVGAMSSDAFASFFERKMQEQKAKEEEHSGAHAFITDLEPDDEHEEQVVTDTKNVMDMRLLAGLLKGQSH